MAELKKRSARKSKLEVRDDDDFEKTENFVLQVGNPPFYVLSLLRMIQWKCFDYGFISRNNVNRGKFNVLLLKYYT